MPRPGCCCSCKDALLRLLPVNFPPHEGNSSFLYNTICRACQERDGSALFLRQFRDAAVAVVDVRVFEHVDCAAAPVGDVFLAQRLALGLFLGRQVTLARDARQLADAVHLFLCQGFALLSVFQAVQRGGDAPAAGDEVGRAAAVDRHDRRAAEQAAERHRVAHLFAGAPVCIRQIL